ncbi:hypothetical protein LEMLEM_LOCUS20911 [Lemmus lemmus]
MDAPENPGALGWRQLGVVDSWLGLGCAALPKQRCYLNSPWMWPRGMNGGGAAGTGSDREKYVGGRSSVTFHQHGLPGSLLVLSGLPIDCRCHDLHLHKEPAFERPCPERSTGSNDPWLLLKFDTIL